MLTEHQILIDLFDSAATGRCRLVLREIDRPGAIAALNDWAGTHGYRVEQSDLRPMAPAIDHHLQIGDHLHTISVTEYVR